MPDEFPYYVFLSHNAQDKPQVRRLAERLKAAGGESKGSVTCDAHFSDYGMPLLW